MEETAQLVPPTLKYEAKSAEKSPSKVIEVEEPVNSKISLIFLCVTLGLAPSCKPKTATKPSEVRKAGPTADICPKPEVGSLGLRDPMRLAGLQLATADVEVSETSISILPLNLAAKSAGLSLVAATAADLDVPPIFVMWKACLTDGKTCNNWARSYDFSLDNLAGLPSPFVNKPLKVNLRACVNDPSLIVAEERGKTSNSCTEASPCFCGNELSVSYAPAASTPADAQAAAAIEAAKTKLFNDSQTYINETNSYLASCTQDKGTALHEYAKNIAAYTPQELAYIVDSLGYAMIDFSSSLAQAAQSGAGLGLSEGTMASCLKPSGPTVAGGSSGGEDSWDKPFEPADTGLTTEEETEEGTKAVASTETPPKEEGEGVAPAGAAAKGKEEGGEKKKETRKVNPTLLGLGIGFVVGGAVGLAYFGVTYKIGVGPLDFIKSKTGGPSLGVARSFSWYGRQVDSLFRDLEQFGVQGPKNNKEKWESTIRKLGDITYGFEQKVIGLKIVDVDAQARVAWLNSLEPLLKYELNQAEFKFVTDPKGAWFDVAKAQVEVNRSMIIPVEDSEELRRQRGEAGEKLKTKKMEAQEALEKLSSREGELGKAAAATSAASEGSAKRTSFFSRKPGVSAEFAKLDTPTWKRAAGPAVMIAMMIAGGAMIAAGSSGVGAQLAAGTGSCGDFASLALAHETQLKVDLDALFAAEETRP